MKKILHGKDYYMMVRSHSLVYTAVFELLLESFEKSLLLESFEDILTQLHLAVRDVIFKAMRKDEILLSAADNEILKRQECNLVISVKIHVLHQLPSFGLCTLKWFLFSESIFMLRELGAGSYIWRSLNTCYFICFLLNT